MIGRLLRCSLERSVTVVILVVRAGLRVNVDDRPVGEPYVPDRRDVMGFQNAAKDHPRAYARRDPSSCGRRPHFQRSGMSQTSTSRN